MKFSIQRTTFIKYLNDVQRAISAKTTIDILTGLKMELSKDALTLTGSNADISIETIISIADENAELQIEKQGAIVLPARFISDIVKKLPEKLMSIEVNERFQATISSGSAEFTINGVNAEDYPHLPEIDSNNQLTVPGDILKQVINQTVIAVSNQESRPILTGIHLVINAGQLIAVATDSHRLSQRKLQLTGISEGNYDIIIPGKSLNELAKMIPDNADNIELQISENQALFILGNTSFYTRLLEGKYPDTERLIPKSAETVIECNAVELLQSIERASLLSHVGRNNVVKLTINPEEKTAVLSGHTPEVGNVEEELTFKEVSGNELEISFNPDYMKDGLRAFGQTEIKISFTQALRPFTIVPTEDEENFIHLITPIRTY